MDDKETKAGRRRILRWTGAGLAAGLAIVATVYVRDMGRAYDRIGDRGTVIPSLYGDVEFTHGGSGPPVLVIHGSGGGYDQGELLVEALLGDGFHWIAPSRFGYLRSTFREGATFDDQAHAYAHLLDELGIERVAVVTMSHGGPSALPNERIAAITAPTLVIHAEDDALQLFHNAEYAAATIPGARLLRFERGGHLLMVVEQEAVRAAVQQHILDNDGEPSP